MDNFCAYCSVMVASEWELKAHCNSESHQLTIMSDEGREWKFRAPARGVGADQYALCPMYSSNGKCRFGQLCCDAHGEDELTEWKERYDYRQMKLQHAKECQLQGSHYTEQLLEKWLTSSNPNQIMKERLENVDISINPSLNITVSEKCCSRDWTFSITAKAPLRHVALLYETHRNHFHLSQLVRGGITTDVKGYTLGSKCQEWSSPEHVSDFGDVCYTCKIQFTTIIYGTFRQAVIFDFGCEPVLVQRLCVDVVPVSDLEKLQQARESVVSFTERWSNTDVAIVPFKNRPYPLGEKEECLLSCYPAPNGTKFTVTQSVMEFSLTKNNYSSRLHELLCIEEMAQYELLSRYNIQAHLHLTSCYLLTPNSAATAKYAQNGELFANMQLQSVLSEDSAPGRLVLTNCNTVLLAPLKTKGEEQRKVYEAIIEDKGKTVIYIRLSKRCVDELRLKPDRELLAEVQFQLNRLPLCEMHFAVDRLHPPSLVFPDVTAIPSVPWSPTNNWSKNLDPRLNPKQKEAVLAITTPLNMKLPPVLIIGPFGTGKTFTLAQAVKIILDDPQSRVLVCTHSNSAADIYIREYLHPHVTDGHPEATPLRIYYRHRWVATVHPTVQQYCLVSKLGNDRSFNMPTVEDVKKYKVIVTTLSTSRYLVQLGLEKGFFTHILVDEAAQAMECEAIMPLSLANESTRIVLAGDHMQLSPEVYSQFAQERNLHTSLLERLYDLYPEAFSCKILLCENYRSHEAIIQYTSELFYDNHLLASGQQPRHDTYFPLTFFTARGEDVQDPNSTAFHNNAEVYEIVERVIELKKSWPDVWGEQDETSIGVVTPYYDQVVRIRAELRKKKLHGVSVERVLNVQGKQFRVIFLSAVRTRQTCSGLSGKSKSSESELDHGFLSNAKLLNTAITRAQSLVAVVGDPVSLCSVGKCRKLWEKFIHTCHKENSLFGITWDSLRSHLDGMELKKNYILNPLAPEFVPGRMYHGQPYVPPAGDFWCPNTPPPPPWVLLPLPGPFQGPPMLQPTVAHMMPPPHPYNVGLNCLGPSIMPPPPPPPHAFQNFPYSPAPPRTSGIHPRLSTSIYSRRYAHVRGAVMHLESGSTKEFERGGVSAGRPMKRTDMYTPFNALHKQSSRMIEERNQNHTEHDENKKIVSRSDSQRNINLCTESMDNLSNFRSMQNNLYLDENNKVSKQLVFMKTDDGNNAIVKQNSVTNIQTSLEVNHLNAFSDHQLLQSSMKSGMLNGTWCVSPSKQFSDSEQVDNGIHSSDVSYRQNVENYHSSRSAVNRSYNNDITSTIINERERAASLALDAPLPTPCPPALHSAAACHVAEKWQSVSDSAFNFNRAEMPLSSQASIIHLISSLQEKLLLLEKILPAGTDVKTFVDSLQQQKGFYFYLLASEGPAVAKRFVSLIGGIKKDQECISKHQHLINALSESGQWNKGYHVLPSRNISDFAQSSPLRNVPSSMPFMVSRSHTVDNSHHSELPNVSEAFGIELPTSSFPFSQGLTADKIEANIFATEDKNVLLKPSISVNHLKDSDLCTDDFAGKNGMTFDKSCHEQLSFELSRKLSLMNRNENKYQSFSYVTNDENCVNNSFESQRQSESELGRQSREHQKQLWAPAHQQGEHSVLGISSQDSYLSMLRNISNTVVSTENNNHSLTFDVPRSEAKRTPMKMNYEAPAHVTAGPLSVSYPDIPDILSSHILPNKEDVSSKVIRKPNLPRHSADESFSNLQQHPSQLLLELSQTNNSQLQFSHLSSEGMTYAKILRSPQP